MDYMDVCNNPMVGFPKIKPPGRKFKEILSENETEKLINAPRTDTILGLRDRAIIIMLCGAGLRSSECATLKEKDVKISERILHITGKGGDERSIPLNDEMAESLHLYRCARGRVDRNGAFFRSRKKGKGLSRQAIYERVKTYARKARIKKCVSPHTLRHTFATHILNSGINLVTLQFLLGHRFLTSTQIYIHITAVDIRKAIYDHPFKKFIKCVRNLPSVFKLPFQNPPGTVYAFNRGR
jgi:site-specific recombinase XerD